MELSTINFPTISASSSFVSKLLALLMTILMNGIKSPEALAALMDLLNTFGGEAGVMAQFDALSAGEDDAEMVGKFGDGVILGKLIELMKQLLPIIIPLILPKEDPTPGPVA